MSIHCSSPEAYNLFHESSIAFAQIESNGIRIDLEYLKKASARLSSEIKRLQGELEKDRIFHLWKKQIFS